MHTAQQMPLPLTVSCFIKVQIGFTFLVPAHPGSPGKRVVKRVCVCVCVLASVVSVVVGFALSADGATAACCVTCSFLLDLLRRVPIFEIEICNTDSGATAVQRVDSGMTVVAVTRLAVQFC